MLSRYHIAMWPCCYAAVFRFQRRREADYSRDGEIALAVTVNTERKINDRPRLQPKQLGSDMVIILPVKSWQPGVSSADTALTAWCAGLPRCGFPFGSSTSLRAS